MKKFALTLSALAVMASAQAATLDVHGDIKVNGKTVITEAGEVVLSNGVDLAKYMKMGNGVGVYEGTWSLDNPESDGLPNHDYIRTGDENGLVTKVLTQREGEGGYTNTYNGHITPSRSVYKESWGGNVTDNVFSLTTKFGFALLGQTVTIIEKYSSTSSNTYNDEPATQSHTEKMSVIPLRFTTYTFGDETYSDCLVYAEDYPNWHTIVTSCAGVGRVEMEATNDEGLLTSTEKLISFTPH